MAIDEAARHHLHQTLDDTIGPTDAITLMEHLPPVGWADVATNSALDNLEDRLGARIDRLVVRIDGLDARIDRLEQRMDRLEQRVDTEFAAVRAQIANLELRCIASADLAGLELRLVERMRRHDQILIATLLPLTLSLIGLLATAILRAPTS